MADGGGYYDNGQDYTGDVTGGCNNSCGGDTYDPGLDFGSAADPYQTPPIDSTLAGNVDSGDVGGDSADYGYSSGNVGAEPGANSYGGVRQGDDPSADNYDPALDPSYGDNSSAQTSSFRQGDDPSASGYDPSLDPNYGAPDSATKSGPGFWSRLGDSILGSGKSGGAAPASSGVPAIASGSSNKPGSSNSTPDAITSALLKLANLEKAIVGAVNTTKQAINGTGGTQAGKPQVATATSGAKTSTLIIVASVASIVGLAILFVDRRRA